MKDDLEADVKDGYSHHALDRKDVQDVLEISQNGMLKTLEYVNSVRAILGVCEMPEQEYEEASQFAARLGTETICNLRQEQNAKMFLDSMNQ